MAPPIRGLHPNPKAKKVRGFDSWSVRNLSISNELTLPVVKKRTGAHQLMLTSILLRVLRATVHGASIG